jgi:tRNA(Ile)-lysidine synthase
MPRAAHRAPASFGPHWLAERLTQLLPGFPDVVVCVAFSGGADSTALLAALSRLPQRPRGLRALHIDHHLHPHSARWSAHCRRAARALGVPLAVRSARIARRRGESPEAAARAERYRLLGAALAAGEALLTAHTQDDQLETVLLQLLRGAGVAGMAAMPPRAPFARGVLARPLLEVPHASLLAWLRAEDLTWVEDDSNLQPRFDRNYLRLHVLPVIRARWPSAAATVARSARHAAEAQRLLDALGAADAARAGWGAMLSAQVLRTLTPERRRNTLRFWITAAGYLAPPTSRLEEIAGALLSAREDAQPFVAWEGAIVQREGELLSVRPRLPGRAASRARRVRSAAVAVAPATVATEVPPGPAGPVPGAAERAPGAAEPAPGTAEPLTGAPAPAAVAAATSDAAVVPWHWHDRRTCVLPFGTLVLRRDAHGPLDLDALAPILSLRVRRGGERLRPVRGGPRRALKSLLQEARVPVALRAQLPLVFDGERLIAAADLWLDESVQARTTSARRGRLVWSAST